MATSPIGTSSIDVNGIVSQLMTLERRPLQVLAQREAAVTARIAAIARVQGAVSSLQTAAASLASAGTWNGVRASATGDGAAAAVSDATKATAGRYSLKVTQLATSQALASGQFDATTEVLGNGTLTLQIGSTSKTITLDATNNTLAGVRDAINAAKAGVSASLVNDGGKVRLTLTASDTGAANTIKLSVLEEGTVAGDAANGDATGLSRLAFDGAIALTPPATTATGRNLVQTRAAADAAFEINGLALTSAANKVTGVIDGVSLDLKKASDTAVTEIAVDRDSAGMRAAVEGFIKAYNDLDKTIRDVTSFDATTRRAAVLNGDGSVRSLQNQLRGLLRSSMNAANAGDFTQLSEVGIEVGRDGAVSLSAARFETALADPDKLGRLFRTANDSVDSARGFGVRFENFAKSIAGADGLLPARTKGLQSQVDGINKQEDQFNQRLIQVEARLKKQYTALDAQLSRMQGTSNSLANALSQLPGANNGG